MEIFRNIFGYEELFRIGSNGNLYDVSNNTIVEKLNKSTYGYYYYQFNRKGKHVNLYIHKEVAKAFTEICGEYKAGYIAHHINGNKEDNRAINLTLMSQRDHIKTHCKEDPSRIKNLGKGFHQHHSEKTKKLLSEKLVGKNKGKDNYLSKPILMLDKNTGKVLKEFESIHIAGEYLGNVKKQANIWKCLRNKIPTAYGYKWEYKKVG